MAPLMLLVLLLSAAASDLIDVTVHPGDNATLPCQADNSSIRVAEWTRPDLKPDIVLYYSDEHLDPTDQHPSFKDRVELVDRDLKDGNVSLTLKNVSRHDAGTYECRVVSGGSPDGSYIRDSEPIRTIRLQVIEPAGPEDRNSSPGGLLVGLAAGVTDLNVTVHPGDDVTLPCQAADSSIRAEQWTRADLKPDIVLLNRDGHLNTTHQHPSFKDRVELVDRDLKDGNMSLTLKNVSRHDAGEYKCRVKTDDSDQIRTIRIISLQVRDPADSGDGPSSPVGLIVGLAGVLLLVAVAVGCVLIYKIHKDKRSGPSAHYAAGTSTVQFV
ncbi:uncharacterized protein LOC120572813 [Perca fluviatilis]|uniref:uncharacterized protein LOC120572813 n=1 Tax=Perca fluviatilis TaxID=8168 RepID=UPI0019623546|nr:uncharacterized protein LOC120572813 [Perca fluviatilis]